MQAGQIADASYAGVPTFYVIDRQPIRPAAVVLAVVLFAVVSAGIGYGLKHTRKHHHGPETMSGRSASADSSDDDEADDDPSKVDVVYVGDAGDAPEPTRPAGKRAYHAVHPTIMVQLPRFGPHEGLIPDTAAGHMLYRWLAAFNQSNADALEQAVPSAAPARTSTALLALRFKTGGLRLLSAREVEPGNIVFRLQGQTPDAGEFLGTIRVRDGSAEMDSFGLRAIEAPPVVSPKPAATP